MPQRVGCRAGKSGLRRHLSERATVRVGGPADAVRMQQQRIADTSIAACLSQRSRQPRGDRHRHALDLLGAFAFFACWHHQPRIAALVLQVRNIEPGDLRRPCTGHSGNLGPESEPWITT